MKIGVDLDGVINNTQKFFSDFYYLKTGKYVDFENIKKFDFWEDEAISESKEEIIALFHEFHDQEDTFQLIEGVEEAFDFFSKTSDILVITARPVKFKESTERLLRVNLDPINFEIIFAAGLYGGEKKKSDVCVERGIEVFIEDSKEHAEECAEKGIKVFLLDKPWNQDFEHENVIRARDWNHILEMIREE